MRSTQLTPSLIQLTRLRFVNAYLVREDDGFTLLDATFPGAAESLIDAAEAAGAAIVRVAVTHGHLDHVGSVDALKARLGGAAEILVPARDARILAGEEPKPKGSWGKVQTKPEVVLDAGDRVGSLEVIATPGHTPGHVAFLDTRDQTVIAGDVFVSYGGLTVTNHFHLQFPFAATATWDRQKDLESAHAISDLHPKLLAVGHGPAVSDPGAALEHAIARSARALS